MYIVYYDKLLNQIICAQLRILFCQQKMIQPNELWDLQFFRKYVPSLIRQLKLVDTAFQMLVRSLSQFHHRLTSILIQQPPRFAMQMAKKMYEKVKETTTQIAQQNKVQMMKMAQIVKQFKGSLCDLTNYYENHDQKTKQAEFKVNKIEQLINAHQLLKEDLNKIKPLSQCRYSNSQSILNLGAFEKFNRDRFFKIKDQDLKTQLRQSKALFQYCSSQQAYVLRNCLENMNLCADKIMEYQFQSQKKQTFNFNHRIQRKSVAGRLSDRVIDHDRQKTSQFIHSEQFMQMIHEAELRCEQNSPKISSRKSMQILQAGILAESKDSFGELQQNE